MRYRWLFLVPLFAACNDSTGPRFDADIDYLLGTWEARYSEATVVNGDTASLAEFRARIAGLRRDTLAATPTIPVSAGTWDGRICHRTEAGLQCHDLTVGHGAIFADRTGVHFTIDGHAPTLSADTFTFGSPLMFNAGPPATLAHSEGRVTGFRQFVVLTRR